MYMKTKFIIGNNKRRDFKNQALASCPGLQKCSENAAKYLARNL